MKSTSPILVPDRRTFLKSSAAAGALASAVAFPHVANAAAAGDKIKIGWVGCGGRGTGAANQALNADSNLVMWSMGDVFQDKIDSGLESLKKEQAKNPEKVSVAPERQFTGLDAFQKVLNSGVDVVLLTTSPGFRPQHIRAAIEAGKRVVVAAHGNSIRALIKYLDGVSDADIVGLNIPNGIPLVYELDAQLRPIRHYYLGDAEAAALSDGEEFDSVVVAEDLAESVDDFALMALGESGLFEETAVVVVRHEADFHALLLVGGT